MYVYIYICIYKLIHVYIYIYRDREREMYTHTYIYIYIHISPACEDVLTEAQVAAERRHAVLGKRQRGVHLKGGIVNPRFSHPLVCPHLAIPPFAITPLCLF